MVKISDIAKKANVSVSSVSLVLNGKEGVGKKKREIILKIAKEMNYIKNPISQISEKKGDIRFLRVIKHGHIINRDHNVFLADYIEGLSNISKLKSYNLEIATSNEDELLHTIEYLNKSSIDGIIILGTELSRSDIDLFTNITKPIVFIDTYYPNKSFDFVDMDNFSAVYKIVENFIINKHRNIGIITTNVESQNFRQRESAFFHATNELLCNKTVKYTVGSTYEDSYNDFKTFIETSKDLPSAIFCINDIIALGCMKALHEAKILIPDDISIVGFDNLPQSTTSTPPLTTINVEKQNIGELAMNMLINRIESKKSIPLMKVSIGTTLIIRESVKKN